MTLSKANGGTSLKSFSLDFSIIMGQYHRINSRFSYYIFFFISNIVLKILNNVRLKLSSVYSTIADDNYDVIICLQEISSVGRAFVLHTKGQWFESFISYI